MADPQNRVHELEYLGGKVYQAKDLINRLRESNRALTSRLREMEQRLQSIEAVATHEVPVPAEPTPSVDARSEGLAREVERLRKERGEIRERVSNLLERIESLEI